MSDESQQSVYSAYAPDNAGRRGRPRRPLPVLISFIVGIILLYLLVWMPLPFYIFMPGSAEVIAPMVTVKEQVGEDKGSFMLTTVQVSDSSVLRYLIALVHPYQEIQLKQDIFSPGESEEEYVERQEYVMLTSQSSAMQAAYAKAGVPYQIKSEGVMVLQTIEGMPAETVLHPGDMLLKVDDVTIQKRDDLLSYLKDKKAGTTVKLTYKHKDKETTADLVLALLPKDESGVERAGLGVSPADLLKVKADKPEQQIEIQPGEISGPSAGLMFSLEILNRLLPEDISKGHKIAGTGTIDEKGNVGPIGGIQHKIIAADKAGAEVFFAPKDITVEGRSITNYSDAVKRAEQIGTKMKIVSVGTMDDAIKYLKELPEKK